MGEGRSDNRPPILSLSEFRKFRSSAVCSPGFRITMTRCGYVAATFLAILAQGDSFAAPISPGSKIPWADLHWGFPPKLINVPEYCQGRSVVIVGLPGAFTPTCSSTQVPGYLENQEALKAVGVDEVVVYCVNDGAVMANWNQQQLDNFGKENNLITFMGDPSGEFTKLCGMEMTDPRPAANGIIGRCKRFAMHVVNNVVKYVAVSESDDDPAGDANPEASCAPAIIEAIKAQMDSPFPERQLEEMNQS
jgi:peroxiredoxin